MKNLDRSILEAYEIEPRCPSCVQGVQFGDDAVLLGTVDRLLDDAGVGLALVQTREDGHAAALKTQEGLYTAFTRREEAESNTVDEHVVQCITEVFDPEMDDAAIKALAAVDTLRFAIVHADPADGAEQRMRDAALLTRFLIERAAAGKGALTVLAFADAAEYADTLREEVLRIAEAWNAAEAMDMLKRCVFLPALADSMSTRADAEEALRLCRRMNYKDAMIHICEGRASVTVAADDAFRAAFPWDQVCPSIRFAENIETVFMRRQRLFDTGIALMTSVGFFRGAKTLKDCMKDEAMREWLGHCFVDEILPYLSADGAKEALIDCYARYDDGSNENLLEYVGRGLVGKLIRGILPAIRAYEKTEAVLPERLVAALSAAILLLSDVRRRDGQWTVIAAQDPVCIREPEELLTIFSRFSSDMPADALAYAVLSDAEIWGTDLRRIEGLLEAVMANLDN